MLKEYATLAPHYDRRWSFYVEETLRQTQTRLDLAPGESLLDVGCGTGVLLEAISISVPNAKLSGVDASPEMLKVARQRLDAAVLLQQGRVESLPFSDESFDVVVSTNAFHYFHNPLGALAEMARVLRPSGRLVITDWCDDYFACQMCDLWLRLCDRAHFRTYGEKQCRRLIAQAGFAAVRVDPYKINWFWGLMTAVATWPSVRPGIPAIHRIRC